MVGTDAWRIEHQPCRWPPRIRREQLQGWERQRLSPKRSWPFRLGLQLINPCVFDENTRKTQLAMRLRIAIDACHSRIIDAFRA